MEIAGSSTVEPQPKNSSLTAPVATLEHKAVGEIRGHFWVPRYQRGYRWDPSDVSRLLDDIWGSKGQSYSLQPIVVKLHHAGDSPSQNVWELIDGQQRLTTLYLVLNYIHQQGWRKLGAPYTLEFETRPDSQRYMNTPEEASHEKNIDYYHLYRAHLCVDAWFRSHGDEQVQDDVANTLHGYLFKSVRVIWYRAPEKTNANELFTRLNIGRIPLTDAELIKAALLSAVRRYSTERAHEVAAQWDGIERDLHQGDIWAFVAGLTPRQGHEKYPTRISLLLDSLAEENAQVKGPEKARLIGKRPRYFTFDTLRGDIEQDCSAFWKKVVALHAQILGWAEQPKLYNKIGFLVASGDAFGTLSQAAKGKKKSEFELFLVERIRVLVNIDELELQKLNYEEQKRGYPKLLQLLLLLNVETATISGLRFPFFRHVGEKWTLEHIHAQNAETLTKAEQWKTWLVHHKSALDAVVSDSNRNEITLLGIEIGRAVAEIDAGKSGGFSAEKFNAMSPRVLKILNQDVAPDHSIRNMALLSSTANARLSNSVFEVKRQLILELDRKGAYVPVCTRNVFLKYYAEADAQQPHFWGETDKASYIKEICSKIKPYFSASASVGESTE